MTASPFIPAEAAEQVFGDMPLALQLLEALERGDGIAGIDDAADWLTETLGRPRKDAVKRSLQRMARRGALTLDPIAIPPWARLALTGAPAPGAAAGDAGKARIPLDRLEPNPWNPRKSFDPDALAELSQSMLTAGLAHDALVRPHPDKPGLFQIVAGERRWRAAQLLSGQGEASDAFDPADGLPCDVRDLTDAQARALTYAENAVRKDPTGLEQCDALAADKARLEAEDGDVGAYLHAMAGSLGYKNIRPVQHMILVGEKLIAAGREAFADGAPVQMKLAHARVIAGAAPDIQRELVAGFTARKPGFTTEADLSKRRQERELLDEQRETDEGNWTRRAAAELRAPAARDEAVHGALEIVGPQGLRDDGAVHVSTLETFDASAQRPMVEANDNGVYAEQDHIIFTSPKAYDTVLKIRMTHCAPGLYRWNILLTSCSCGFQGPTTDRSPSAASRSGALHKAMADARAEVEREAANLTAGSHRAQVRRKGLSALWRMLGRETILDFPAWGESRNPPSEAAKAQPTDDERARAIADAIAEGGAPDAAAPHHLTRSELYVHLGAAVRSGAITLAAYPNTDMGAAPEDAARGLELFKAFAALCQSTAHQLDPDPAPAKAGGHDLLYPPREPDGAWRFGRSISAKLCEPPSPPIAVRFHCTAQPPERDPAPSAPDAQGNYAPQEIVTFIDGIKGRQAGHEGDEVAALLAVALDGQWRVGWRIRLGAVHREQPPQRSKRAKHPSRSAAIEAARIACARELTGIDAGQTVSDAKTRAHKALRAMSKAHVKVAEIAQSAGAVAVAANP